MAGPFLTQAQVKKEMSLLPLVWVQTSEVLPRQHIIIFTNRPTVSQEASATARSR